MSTSYFLRKDVSEFFEETINIYIDNYIRFWIDDYIEKNGGGTVYYLPEKK